MNPNWVVVRPRRGAIEPLKRGAVDVLSIGLHLASKGDRWRLTTSQPDTGIMELIVPEAELTLAALALLRDCALPKTDRRQVVVWCHGLADSIGELFRGFKRAFACSTEPVVRWHGDAVSVEWQGYHEVRPGRVQLETAEMALDSEEAGPAQLAGMPTFRLALLRGPIGAATLTFEGCRSIRMLDSQAFVRAELGSQDVRGIVAHAVKAKERGLRGIHPAAATRVLGERIAEVWTLLDVAPAPTPAATGAKLFRRKFLEKPLKQVPYHVESAAELAFHGGKVGLWTERGVKVPKVHVYDMRSAYSAAMMVLPSFYSGQWTRSTRPPTVTQGSLSRVTPGFYRVSGSVTSCRWPMIPSHNGEWIYGGVKRTWITSYELAEALASKEIVLDECFGWEWQEESAASSPWESFSEEVFRRRDLCTDALRSVYKGTLVGLYGKTVQRTAIPPVPPDGLAYEHGVPIVYCNSGKPNDKRAQYFRAGGFYYPAVGCLTTGLVRAWVHQIEHQYEAVHTAVDAVHTLRELPDRLIGPGIGQWRHLGTGTAVYHGPNNYTVVGLNGWRKHAASGVSKRAGTDDAREAM